MRIVSVTVTYRRKESLIRCVDSIERQTHPVDISLVVDNDAQASDVLSGYDLEVIAAPGNLGPAGGYGFGIKQALDRGADKVWFVDDDCEPKDDCLETLLRHDDGAAVLIPMQVRPDGSSGFPPSWTGTLIDAAVVRDIGLPDERLFFSKEDSEYFKRAREHGYPMKKIPEAVALHHHAGRRKRREPYDWRLYYQVRNHLHYWLRMRRLSGKGLWRAVKVGVGMPFVIIFLRPEKASGLRLWWMGVRDFARGRLGKTLDPELWGPDHMERRR